MGITALGIYDLRIFLAGYFIVDQHIPPFIIFEKPENKDPILFKNLENWRVHSTYQPSDLFVTWVLVVCELSPKFSIV